MTMVRRRTDPKPSGTGSTSIALPTSNPSWMAERFAFARGGHDREHFHCEGHRDTFRPDLQSYCRSGDWAATGVLERATPQAPPDLPPR